MLDVFVILACVCLCVLDFVLMSGQARGMFSLYEMSLGTGLRSDVGASPRNAYMFMLYVHVICLLIDICIPDLGLMPGETRCPEGLMSDFGTMSGIARCSRQGPMYVSM